MKVYEEIRHILQKNGMAVLRTEWKNPTEEALGELRQWVEADSGEGADMFHGGKPMAEIREEGGSMWDPFLPEDRLIVLGGGHVALPLVEFADRCGFAVTLVDDRAEFANSQRFPWAKQVICDSFPRSLEALKIRRQDYVVILTRGHQCDSDCLRTILRGEEPGYLGMIGSRRRVAMVKENLIQEGYSSERLGRLHSPIGLKIGAVTPAEIAVSILSELILTRRSEDGDMLRSQSDVDYAVIDCLAEACQIPRVLMTVISAQGSVPRGAGARMVWYSDGRTVGSIGGGSSEAAALGIAARLAGTGRWTIEHIALNQDAAAAEGMVCGGRMDVLIQDVKEDRDE